MAAGVTGGVIGGLGGAALAAGFDGSPWWVGALVGAFGLGGLTAWTDATRVPGQPKRIIERIVTSALIAAIVGALLEWVLPDWSAIVPCAALGAVVGALGFRTAKVVLGVGIGVAVGWLFDLAWPEVGWAVPVALTVLVYRTVAAVIWRGRDQIRIVGEQIGPDEAPFLVPFREATKHVGVDYLERYAGEVGASFVHHPPDIGIVDDFDALAGPSFDPSRVDPLIREFYEHTSRFELDIIPEWKRRMRIPFLLYRATVAGPIGQANAPFDQREVQEGVVSWIDTIDLDDDGVVDYRAWVRAYANGKPIYVGIYTVQRLGDTAYVSVGFPLPSGNFTATLIPTNHRGSGLLLRSSAVDSHAGHYLSVVEDDGRLTTLQLASFGEEIDVFVDASGVLKTEHRFSIGRAVFLTLHYDIRRA